MTNSRLPFVMAIAALILSLSACAEKTALNGPTGSGNVCRQDADCGTGFVCQDTRCVPVQVQTVQDAGQRTPDSGTTAGLDDASVVVVDAGDIDAGTPDAGDAGSAITIGQRCSFDSDCASGICVQTASLGNVCTSECVNDCPTGWGCRSVSRGHGLIQALCFPVGDIYCVRCAQNDECPQSGDRCTNVGGATYCTQDCAARGCSAGFECRDVNPDGRIVNTDAGVEPDADGGVVKQCIPTAGLCPGCIDPDGDQYGIGANCLGKDCDETSASINAGATEICDSKDNNCDGQTDEGFDLQASMDNCGACGIACANANGQTACVSGHCVPTCTAGFWDCDGNPVNGCETALVTVQFCGTCTDDASCPGDFFCNQGACEKKRPTGTTCGATNQCASGFCADGYCCNEACSGTCRSCSQAAAQGTCTVISNGDDPDNECGDDGRASCGRDGACDGQGACRKYAAASECVPESCSGTTYTAGKTCDGAGTCGPAQPQTTNCAPYRCGATTCRTSCADDSECVSTHQCVSGSCKLRNAETCANGTECASGNCVDGVCCNEACNGTCRSCNIAGKAGICSSYTGGADPESECAAESASTCGLDGACDGQGACRKHTSGTSCVSQSCGGSTQSNRRDCDGTGTCQTGTTTNCAPYVCNGTGCRTSCTQDSHCVSTHACVSGQCKSKQSQACTLASQCASGFCVDGYCCNSACSGNCRSCAVAGSEGVCSNYAAGADPESDCAASGASTCGQNGACDGNGACGLWASQTECQAASCSGSTLYQPRKCNGTGTCSPSQATTVNCSPYNCESGACRTTCTSDSNCVATHQCVSGTCKLRAGQTCTAASQCGSGFCADGVCCDGACGGTCRSCNQTGKVGTCSLYGSGVDPEGECSANSTASCGQNGYCDGNGSCQKYANGTTCQAQSCTGSTRTNARNCDGTGTCTPTTATTTTCGAYKCNSAATDCLTTCATTSDCVTGYQCASGQCKLAAGLGCGADGDCASGYCTDGVCCNARCNGTCQACNATGAVGTCTNFAAGSDPEAECSNQGAASCGSNGFCDGQGACQKYTNGTTCVDESCTAGTWTYTRVCNGSGTCSTNSPTTQSCAPYTCDAAAKKCILTCASDAQCVTGYGCVSGICKKKQGQSCASGTECATGVCSDGVCCNMDCSGSCRACNKTGSVGTCTYHAATSDPESECADQGAATCGRNGWCDGAGACQKYASGTTCVAQSCTGSTQSNARSCDGTGTCGALTTTSCSPYVCGAGACKTSCTANSDCVSGYECASGVCKKAKGQTCSVANECASGFCADGYCCSSACNGTCQSCNQSGLQGACTAYTVGSDPESECADQGSASCGTNGSCDGASACQRYASGTVCTAASCSGTTYTKQKACNGTGTCVTPSPATTSCGAYACGATSCKSSCAADSDCSSSYYCASGVCAAKKANGNACTATNQCGSGNCIDGTCCNSTCGGSCQSCKLAGSLGTCTNIASGQDPDNECSAQGASSCGTTGTCNGAGACQKYASGTTCVAQSCSGTTQTNAKTCDGTGTCTTPSPSTTSCGAYACGATGCKTSCTADSDCASGNYCASGVCTAKKTNGNACTATNQCGSGNCVDGYCCNSSCGGTCQSCKLAGSLGACTSIPSGQDPNSECASSSSSTCGQNGSCNGASACAYWPSSTVCVAQSCSNGVHTFNRYCSGGGACSTNATATESCGNYACNSTATTCRTSCSSDSHCTNSNYYCNSSYQCVAKKATGLSCTASNQCSSGSCCSGVCRDLTSDTNNCGSCGTVCQAVNGSNTCSAGACVPTCYNNYYNTTGATKDGCNCYGGAYETTNPSNDTSSGAVNLGSVSQGSYATIASRALPAGDEDWYQATMIDDGWEWSDSFGIKVTLQNIASNVDLDLAVAVWRPDLNDYEWKYSTKGAGLNECIQGWNGTAGPDDTKIVWVKVSHYSGIACFEYTLVISNTQQGCP